MIKFVIPGMPPSSNNAWFNIGAKGRTPTKEHKKYKNESKTYIVRTYPTAMTEFRKNEPYTVFFRLHVAELENATFGQKKGAENRYKKNDATNRIKILEDLISEVSGIDDSSTMAFVVQKVQAKGPEQVEVFIWNTLREESPFDEPLSRL